MVFLSKIIFSILNEEMLLPLIVKSAKAEGFFPFYEGRQISGGEALEEKQVKASREQYFVRNTVSPGTGQISTVFISLS